MVKKQKDKVELTPEEKLLKKEQEAIAAEADKVKKGEIALRFLKEKLAQEELNSRISTAKLNSQWMDIMRRAKSDELHAEILILSQTFEREVDRKEAILQGLFSYVSESEQQDYMSARSHMRNIDTLINVQNQRVAQLHAEFETELDIIKSEFMAERSSLLTHHTQEKGSLKDVLFTMQGLHTDKDTEAANDLSSKRDEIRSKSLESKATLKGTLEGYVTELWELYQQTLKSYEHSTHEKKIEFDRLRLSDLHHSENIAQQSRRLTRLAEKIAARKTLSLQRQRDFDERNKDLKAQKESVLVHLQRLKEQMTSARCRARSDLTQLTLDSRACHDVLTERLELGQQILKQAEICRKMETLEEKVLPFYADTHVDGLDHTPRVGEVVAADQNSAVLPDGHLADERSALDLFWKRYNKVLLDKAAIERDREDQAAENARLRSLLKIYLDGISVSEDVIRNDNSLFIVNNRSNVIAHAVPVGDARVKGIAIPYVHSMAVAPTGRNMAPRRKMD